VLPILHLNGYKISNPTVLARIEPEELDQFLCGCGWDPHFHDSSDCPHGAGITRDEDPPGAEYPRRCNWCTEHDRPTPS